MLQLSIPIILLLSSILNVHPFQQSIHKTRNYNHRREKHALKAVKSPSLKKTIPSSKTLVIASKQSYELNNDLDNIIQEYDEQSNQDFLQEGKSKEYNWDFLDAVYLITCDNDTTEDSRLNRVRGILDDINLLDKVQIAK